ncbi:MAG: homogentisate 1,2-dioxygenase [Gammaproteobacteria bacterium]|nr:homogentisate 1,2-dioxygenase [Gammaproteobacteria bacterium]
MSLQYLSGFGNEFASEALPDALPVGQNSPQRCPYGLYAEQLSGTAFTAPNATNARTWFYRIRPSVQHVGRLAPCPMETWKTAPHAPAHGRALGQLRWDPPPAPERATTFVTGMHTMTTAGDARTRTGMAAHVYFCSEPMENEYFYNADAEMLVVPERGVIRFSTECGELDVGPQEICVLPRGMKFSARPLDGAARGYMCENYGARFCLPERGPIGANGLANPRDFLTPVSHYVDAEVASRITVKWCGEFFDSEIGHSPLDVVAWHGNYVPYKYDLRRFCPVGAIGFDHPDPSIFTVLTASSEDPGTANIDFVIFPERWLVAEHTFRPPWFHMNVMSEFMGLLAGVYDAKPEGFVPGGMSLHNSFLPHGPDAEAFERAASAQLAPVKLEQTLAFMFETRFPQQLTEYAAALECIQDNYADCWTELKKHFDPTRR